MGMIVQVQARYPECFRIADGMPAAWATVFASCVYWKVKIAYCDSKANRIERYARARREGSWDEGAGNWWITACGGEMWKFAVSLAEDQTLAFHGRGGGVRGEAGNQETLHFRFRIRQNRRSLGDSGKLSDDLVIPTRHEVREEELPIGDTIAKLSGSSQFPACRYAPSG